MYKIGYSVSPDARTRNLKSQVGLVEQVHTFWSGRASRIESLLHERFAERSVGGEWFRLTPDDVALLCSVQSCDSESDLPSLLLPARRKANKRPGRTHMIVEMPEDLLAELKEAASNSGRHMKYVVECVLRFYLKLSCEGRERVFIQGLAEKRTAEAQQNST